MNLKGAFIVLLIIASLLPAHYLYKYLANKIEPRRSGKRFLLWMISVFVLIFLYTFLVVFLIRLIFYDA
jgi:hypothetical protein